MPTYTWLEIAWDQIEWDDVLKLLRASGSPGVINVFRNGAQIFASTHALRSEDSREAWMSDARKFKLSTSFVDLAEWAAGNGISMICAKQGLDLDPAVPFQRLRSKEGSEILPGGTEPARFVICDEGDTMFPYPRDEDLVRWIVDWQRMEVIVVQVQEFCDDEWVDAGAELFGQVEEMIDRVGYAADPEFWGLVLSDELPDWGRHALNQPEVPREISERYLG